ncbi:CaiB/BaiF CoA-transferase family protein [Microbacterium sp. CPCC 204701]|uniref:CaiB/BaiF CoA-transferase family protein n=1 Tax=Microbacterium sp. CPCC 204701 TaxID=2493084 RepID=UPI000FD6F55D|nr:CoA transferase [Microbacterium sp. CPCC 204701]
MTAFHGVRVLELATGIAGPVAGSFFADFGADVIKVEPPEGDPSRRSPAFVAWNRGKRGTTARSFVESERDRVAALATEVDLVIARDVAQVAEWGIPADELVSAEGGPVVLELPPFQGTPPWYGGAESQALLSAASGYSRRQSSFDGGPVDMVYPHLLYIQAVLGASAASAALIERLRSGRGQVVTVDGMHAVAEAFTGNYSLDPAAPVADTAVGPRGLNPTYCHYRASDGLWFLVGGLTPKFQARILRAVGEGWIIDDPRVAADLSRLFSPSNREWVRAVLDERMATRPRAEWLEVLREAGVPSAPLNAPAEAFAHEHTLTLGVPVQITDAEWRDVTVVGQPVVATATPAQIRSGAPAIGSPIDAVGWHPREKSASGTGWVGDVGGRRATGGPLEGVRVLLLGTFVAGPYGAFLLGHLGADVIKIESPEGDPWRERGFYYSDGMRSVVVDLKRHEGREVFERLAADADVIVDNLRPGVGASLGIDFASIAAYNPDVITMSLTGFGQQGPLAMEPGFDPVLQAWSGMCVAQGGDDIPVLYTVPVNDVAGAALIAFGACAGLYHRLRTGEGQAMSTSLVAASMFMQSGQLVSGDFESLVPSGGRDYLGPSELDRYYRAADGWVRIQALPSTDAAVVRNALGGGAEDALEELFSRTDAAIAVERLTLAGVPAVIARVAKDVVVSGDHVGRFTLRRPFGDVTYFRPQEYAAFSRTRYDQEMYPPGAGEHTREVLDEIGLGDGAIERLIESGTVVQGAAMQPRILNPYR